ncbi:hypothetical protein TCA2_4472 [Paenibacillus sp. TCA20]|uniref:Uncharacterized protein n=1 Tax=Paenibacillus urinalis TaxID=521520 RepID=A0ABY7XHC4_9BACL|nr:MULTISPECIES: hypothetical protein [Paenibacillus]WDI05192.1 hypothetical protein PUW25_25625 [Paenibacillus urinalis]GAK41980.1 hypothetical protein TCA2_4472 [Paenibacillus sp. TCA20]
MDENLYLIDSLAYQINGKSGLLLGHMMATHQHIARSEAVHQANKREAKDPKLNRANYRNAVRNVLEDRRTRRFK